ncbi:MAG: glutathione peroxidase [Gammaproteobacteria bacterium]|nr:glutathione peroxidase [Gammaproteobacteria bacterium]MBT8152167.1 glutathione peroxidase [Gammaproteobacteria bacterium]NND39692.1 glutathione peroxidase [Pseudomonadales bacterium]
MKNLYDHSFTLSDGSTQSLAQFRDNVLLLVNTASKCGFTPQFEGLESLHKKYADKGLAIIGFPCNQFGSQDPGSIDEITEFCQLNYGVSFPIAEKIEVNGGNTHPLFADLKKNARGLMGSEKIKWNFTKFLVGPGGEPVKRYAPTTKPQDLERDIESLLG